MDPFPPRDPPTHCDPVPKPGVIAFRDWALERWGGKTLGIVRACPQPGEVLSHHHEGRAWDWAPPSNVVADAMLAELFAGDGGEFDQELARRAGVRYAIWNGRIRVTRPGGDWRPYTGPSAHTEHVHFSFSHAGAAGETSLFVDEVPIA